MTNNPLSWFTSSSIFGIYYSPFVPGKTVFQHPGPGDRPGTPKEWCDKMNELMDKKTGGYPHSFDNGFIQVTDLQDKDSVSTAELPGGIYSYKRADDEIPERLIPLELRNDTYIEVSNLTSEIKVDVEDFLANEAVYREDGSLYKIGFLLYGPPGTGKSSILRELLRHNFPSDTVIVYLYSVPTVEFIKQVQLTLASRLKIFVFEELVTVVESVPLPMVLNFLDGENSVDRSITFATTNYPEKLPQNIVDRPSRFDKRYKLGVLSASDRSKLMGFYLKRPLTAEELKATQDLSAASLIEISRLVRIRKLTVEQAVRHLRVFSELVKKDFGTMRRVGFMGDDQ